MENLCVTRDGEKSEKNETNAEVRRVQELLRIWERKIYFSPIRSAYRQIIFGNADYLRMHKLTGHYTYFVKFVWSMFLFRLSYSEFRFPRRELETVNETWRSIPREPDRWTIIAGILHL